MKATEAKMCLLLRVMSSRDEEHVLATESISLLIEAKSVTPL